MRQDIEHNPHKYLSNTPGGVQAFASQPPEKLAVFLSSGGMLCVSASFGWCRTQNKQHPFLLRVGSVCTICVLSFFLKARFRFLLLAPLGKKGRETFPWLFVGQHNCLCFYLPCHALSLTEAFVWVRVDW